MTTLTLEDRVQRLERQNRIMKVAGLGAALALAPFIALSQSPQATAQPEAPASNGSAAEAPASTTSPLNIGRLAYGVWTRAVGASVVINKPNPGDKNRGTAPGEADIMLWPIPNGYPNRDQVALYVAAHAPARFGESERATTYSPTSVSSTDWNIDLARVLPGMMIDTKHKPKLTGMVQSVDPATHTITVDRWVLSGAPRGQTATPADGTGCIINPVTKVWGQNTNVFFDSFTDPLTLSGAGDEIAIVNQKDDNITFWGCDVVNVGTNFSNGSLLPGFHKGTVAHLARGVFDVGYQSSGQTYYGFIVYGDKATPSPINSFWDCTNSKIAYGSRGDHTDLLLFQDAAGRQIARLDGQGNLAAHRVAASGTVSGNLRTVVTHDGPPAVGDDGDLVVDAESSRLYVRVNGYWKSADLH